LYRLCHDSFDADAIKRERIFRKKPKLSYFIWLSVWVVGAGLGYILWIRNPGRIYHYQYLSGALNVLCLGVVGIRLWQGRVNIRLYKLWIRLNSLDFSNVGIANSIRCLHNTVSEVLKLAETYELE